MAKLYDVEFRFDPKNYPGEIQTIGLMGEFLFYKSELTGHTDKTGMVALTGQGMRTLPVTKYVPAQYEDGMCSIGGQYYQEMTFDVAEGVYKTWLKLPAGLYGYGFGINLDFTEPAEGEPAFFTIRVDDGRDLVIDGDMREILFSGKQVVCDPENPPLNSTLTGLQQKSPLYVGMAKDHPEMPWLPPEKVHESLGTVAYISYRDVDWKLQSLGIYLPPTFTREKTYPVIYVSHGGGGNEADWFSQGGIHHIMENLINWGKTEEAILVTMNNSVYPDPEGAYPWNFKKLAKNLIECVIPFVEMIFPVARDPEHRAFCGLSMGGMTTAYMYYHHSEYFKYYGAFSGGFSDGVNYTIDDPNLANCYCLVGCGEKDFAYNGDEIGTPGMVKRLEQAGLPHEAYYVPGSHDWFTWPQLFSYFAENVIWKK